MSSSSSEHPHDVRICITQLAWGIFSLSFLFVIKKPERRGDDAATCSVLWNWVGRLRYDFPLSRYPCLLLVFPKPVKDTELAHGIIVENPVHHGGGISLVSIPRGIYRVDDSFGAAEKYGPAKRRFAIFHLYLYIGSEFMYISNKNFD